MILISCPKLDPHSSIIYPNGTQRADMPFDCLIFHFGYFVLYKLQNLFQDFVLGGFIAEETVGILLNL